MKRRNFLSAVALVAPSLGYCNAEVNGDELSLSSKASSGRGTIVASIRHQNGGDFRLWLASNSWGASNWRVVVVRHGEPIFFYQNPDQFFTRNIPEFGQYSGTAQFALDLNGTPWLTDFSRPFAFESEDIVIVLYEVAPSGEAQKLRIWTGSVLAKASVLPN